ncbi:hypothetical protein SAMN05444414_10340 [Roseovarius marisflavi]|uniref:Uncharacterized protein n=1 Tax=Roseovarius marisflavi TaxID=1054996 RepID=A0A1M6WPW4_9RHOB|nr:hypothetical protein SAMN05444414_10340 [Roseovarius marisflavi]
MPTGGVQRRLQLGYVQQSETRRRGSELGTRKLTCLVILRHKGVGPPKTAAAPAHDNLRCSVIFPNLRFSVNFIQICCFVLKVDRQVARLKSSEVAWQTNWHALSMPSCSTHLNRVASYPSSARARSASSCSKAVVISLISLSGAPKPRATSRQELVASATSTMMRSASPRSSR